MNIQPPVVPDPGTDPPNGTRICRFQLGNTQGVLFEPPTGRNGIALFIVHVNDIAACVKVQQRTWLFRGLQLFDPSGSHHSSTGIHGAS